MRNFLTSVSAAALGLALTVGAPAPVSAESLAGSYLAGRSASARNDFEIAAQYYATALARDPANAELMESGTLAYLALGEVDRALPLAKQILAEGHRSQVARMVVTAGLVDDKDFAALVAQEVRTEGISPWIDGLIKAWALKWKSDIFRTLMMNLIH